MKKRRTFTRERFQNRLIKIRKTIGWTQAEIANRAFMSRTNYINIEAGRQSVNMEMIDKLADAFMMTPKQLLKGIWF